MQRLVAVVVMLLALGVTIAFAQDQSFAPSSSSERFVRRMSGIETCLICHGSYDLVQQSETGGEPENLWVDSDLFLQSVHARLGCTACHTSIDPGGHRLAGAPGIGGGRGCTPCHETAAPTEDQNVSESAVALMLKADGRSNISDALKACINCHPGEYLEYKDSIHGVDVLRNMEQEPPFCIDCHGSHYILPSTDPRAWTNPNNVPTTCLKCHGQATIMQRYDLSKDVGGTFRESFHGLRGELGRKVAICTTCHGTHSIYAPTDPRSKVNALRVASTCGQCHEGAQLNFAAAFTHTKVSRTQLTGLYAVVQTHKWMIVTVLTPLMMIVFADLFRALRERRLAAKAEGKQ